MNHSSLSDVMNRLSDEELPKFLVRFAYNLTVVARNTYVAGGNTLEKPTAMRGLNEIAHRVLAYALHAFNAKQVQLPDEFAQKIFALAELYDCVFELESAVAFSLENL